MFEGDVEPISSTHSWVSDCKARLSSPRPLDRRVSRWVELVAGIPCCAPADERNSFMKPCETDAMFVVPFRIHKLPQFKYIAGGDQDTGKSSSYWLPEFFPEGLSATSFCISILPLKKAPSSIEMRLVTISPTATADFRSSVCSAA